MSKHTPGPWSTGEGKAHIVIYAPDGYAVADAMTYHGKRQADTEANARLIAAAPDLLAVLRTAVKNLEFAVHALQAPKPSAIREDLADAIALLARIEGK